MAHASYRRKSFPTWKYVTAACVSTLLTLMLGLVSLIAPANAVATSFGCAPGFYQVVTGGQLKQLNFSTNTYDNIGTAPAIGQYNAMGYNSLDGYIYGLRLNTSATGSSVIKVFSDGSVSNLGYTTPALPTSSNFYGGDFDGAGNLVVNNTAGSWYKVNISAMTSTAFTLTGTASLPDFAIISNIAYGIEGSTLKRVNLTTGVVSQVSVTGLPSGTYGGAFVANGGDLFVANNSTGAVYRITDYTGSASASVFVTAGSTAANDGAACPSAALPSGAPTLSYKLSYDLGGGTGTTPSTVTGINAGSTTALTDGTGFSRSGYTFDGWNCDNSIGDKSAGALVTQPSADVKCTAKWLAIPPTYSLSYDLGGGTGTTPSTVTGINAGGSTTLTDGTGFSRSGYTFDGWNCDNSIGDKSAGASVTQPSANVKCTAKWLAIPPTYSLSYDLGGGTGTTPSTVTGINAGGSTTLADGTGFSRSGYTFDGWNCDNSIGDKSASASVTQPSANVKCTAKWYLNPPYTLSYDLGGGTGTTPSTVTGLNATDSTTLADGTGFSRSGYTFDGWNCDNSIGDKSATEAVTQPRANVKCTAKWFLNPPYTLSYDLGGGTGTTPSTVTGLNATDSTTLASRTGFTRKGYTFGGWNCDNSIGDKSVGASVTQPRANVKCTAKWIPKPPPYTLSYKLGGGTGTAPSTVTGLNAGDSTTLANGTGFSRMGYQFALWNCDNEIGDKGAGSSVVQPTADVECIAKWTASDSNLAESGSDSAHVLVIALAALLAGAFLCVCARLSRRLSN